jgi:hypothetical protein
MSSHSSRGGDQRAGEGDDLGQRQEGAEDLDDLEGIGQCR